MLFGGKANYNFKLEHIYEYSLRDKTWQRWHKMEVQLTNKYSVALLTWDEKYVIVAGGNNSKDIFVIDIDEKTVKKCDTECPHAGAHCVGLTGDKRRDIMLIHGYVYRDWKDVEIDIPLEIGELIVRFYCMEMLHWVRWMSGSKEREHYTIPIELILR